MIQDKDKEYEYHAEDREDRAEEVDWVLDPMHVPRPNKFPFLLTNEFLSTDKIEFKCYSKTVLSKLYLKGTETIVIHITNCRKIEDDFYLLKGNFNLRKSFGEYVSYQQFKELEETLYDCLQVQYGLSDIKTTLVEFCFDFLTDLNVTEQTHTNSILYFLQATLHVMYQFLKENQFVNKSTRMQYFAYGTMNQIELEDFFSSLFVNSGHSIRPKKELFSGRTYTFLNGNHKVLSLKLYDKKKEGSVTSDFSLIRIEVAFYRMSLSQLSQLSEYDLYDLDDLEHNAFSFLTEGIERARQTNPNCKNRKFLTQLRKMINQLIKTKTTEENN